MIITTADGERISVNVGASRTIRDVKEKIQQRTGFPVDQQLLVAEDMGLEDDLTLAEYCIDNTSALQLILMRGISHDASTVSKITVKTEDGGRFTIDIEPSDTIKQVKKKIRDQEGIPLEEQLLVIGDAESEDQRLISNYNIDDDSAIHLIRMGAPSPPVVSSTASSVTSMLIPLSAYYEACRDNKVSELRKILQTLPVADMNKLESNGSTGLHVACFRGHRDVVELLLRKGASRSIMNRYNCLPFDEAASPEIRQLFERIPGNDRYVASSGRVEWLLVAANANALSARQIEALKQASTQRLESSIQQIIDKYIKIHFRDVEKYDELLGFFNTALKEKNPKCLVKAYTAETGFYTRLNVHLASETDEGAAERRLYIGILAFNPYFDPFRFTGEAYRGMRLTDEDLREYVVNKKVMTKSFLSATTDKEQTKFFIRKSKRHNIHGQAVKASVICTYIIRDRNSGLDVHQLSEYPKEREVLIFPYAVFIVTSIDRRGQSGDDEATEIILTQC